MKIGVLKQKTFIHTHSNIIICIPKGTQVIANDSTLSFVKLPYKIIKYNGKFYLMFYGQMYLVVFPNGGKTPYPMSMLN